MGDEGRGGRSPQSSYDYPAALEPENSRQPHMGTEQRKCNPSVVFRVSYFCWPKSRKYSMPQAGMALEIPKTALAATRGQTYI